MDYGTDQALSTKDQGLASASPSAAARGRPRAAAAGTIATPCAACTGAVIARALCAFCARRGITIELTDGVGAVGAAKPLSLGRALPVSAPVVVLLPPAAIPLVDVAVAAGVDVTALRSHGT